MPTLPEIRECLAKSGITIKTAPGEYVLSYRGSLDAVAVEDLQEALRVGLDMAANKAPPEPPLGPVGRNSRRGQMYRHNLKIAKKRAKQQSRK